MTEMHGENKANSFSFVPEIFPDGTKEVPLTLGEGGRVIGKAVVTFKDGAMTITANYDDSVAKALGLDITYFSVEEIIDGGREVKEGVSIARKDGENEPRPGS